MKHFQEDSIFWVEVEKISPNPYQPRHEFNQAKLSSLADSIRQYGVLQPLVVTRVENQKEDGGLTVKYELIAGERRLRASKIAGLSLIPVVIRSSEETDQMKLELAIIENLQREDLNPIDRARAFFKLVDEFEFTHALVGKKVGKSREYVSNSLRLLSLSEELQNALSSGRITEGHTRPLLMLNDRLEEQQTLYKEILLRKLTVREAESIARRIANEKARKKTRAYNPEIIELEQELTDSLGTRVQIETREVGGKVVIDFFSNDDLRNLLESLNTKGSLKKIGEENSSDESVDQLEQAIGQQEEPKGNVFKNIIQNYTGKKEDEEVQEEPQEEVINEEEIEPRPRFSKAEKEVRIEEVVRTINGEPEEATEPEEKPVEEEEEEGGEDIYSIKNFSI